MLTGVSRSFLAQITRHRIMSPTSASQHYQDYRDWPIVISPKKLMQQPMIDFCKQSFEKYEYMVDQDLPKEEARQVLPNAAAVNMLMTWNARSMLNLFRQRCCNRNVDEMRIFANRFRQIMMTYWPKIIQNCGPPCYTNDCNQGKMRCKEGYWYKIGTAGVKYESI